MISHSRIYIFKVLYKRSGWVGQLAANELSGAIGNIVKHDMPDFAFKDLKIINVCKGDEHSSEIHMDKLKYKQRRVIDKADIAVLRKDLARQLSKINGFEYEQLHVVNDEFTQIPSSGYLKEDGLYA